MLHKYFHMSAQSELSEQRLHKNLLTWSTKVIDLHRNCKWSHFLVTLKLSTLIHHDLFLRNHSSKLSRDMNGIATPCSYEIFSTDVILCCIPGMKEWKMILSLSPAYHRSFWQTEWPLGPTTEQNQCSKVSFSGHI